MGPVGIVVQKVMHELNNPDSSARSIEKAVAFDQAFSARVLRMANSAFYGYGGKITTVQQGIVVLGINTLKALLMAAAANRMLNQSLKGYGLKEGEFWEHSVLTGIGARLLAQKLKYKNPEEVFSAGILHDMGKVFMDPFVVEDGNAMYQMVRDKQMRLDEAETQLFGVHHGLVGQKVSKGWNFPKVFQDVQAYHHDPRLSPQYNQVCAMVGLSSAAAWIIKEEELSHIPLPPKEERESALAALSLRSEVFQDVIVQIGAKWKDAQKFFR